MHMFRYILKSGHIYGESPHVYWHFEDAGVGVANPVFSRFSVFGYMYVWKLCGYIIK